jgi:hypothetical protein
VDSLLENSYTISDLTGSFEGTFYFWKVKAFDIWGLERFSDQIWSFQVYSHTPPEPFSLISPVDEDTVWGLAGTLYWESAEDQDPGDIINYILFYSTDSTFTTKDSISCSTDTFYTLTELLDDQAFYWKVKAYDSYDLERWSQETFSFRTYLPESPGNFALLYPPDSTQTYEDTLTLGWEEPQDPDPDDFILYALFYSQSLVFDPGSTIVVDNLLENFYTADDLIGSDLKRTYFWKVRAFDRWGLEKFSDQAWSFRVFSYIEGDTNGDGEVNVVDAVFLINYLFDNGPVPIPLESGDTNCDNEVNVVDVVYLVNYLFDEGPEPDCP